MAIITTADANTSNPIPESFGISSYENVAITVASANSAAMTSDVVVLTSDVNYRVEFNNTASAASVLIPSGITKLLVDVGDVLHFIRTDTDGNLSIIKPL